MLNLTPLPDQLLQQGIHHHQAGRLAEAERLYRQVLTVQPNQPDAIRYLGVIATQVNQFDVAIQLLRQAIALKPDFPGAWLDLGNAQHGKGQLPEAIQSFQRAAALKPDFAPAYINLGNALHAAGKFDDALAACRRAVELDPNAPEAHNNLANTLLSLEKFDDAIASYRKAVAIKPDYPIAWFNLGNAMRAAKRLDEAVASLQRSIAINPQFPDAIFNLAVTLQDLGRRGEAIAAYRQAIALKPDMSEAHRLLAFTLQANGQLDEAITAYTTAVALKPESPLAYIDFGNVLKARGRIAQAIAAYNKYLALKPDDPLGYNNLGAVMAETGKMQQAIECYRRAVELDPKYMAAHVNLGNVWKDQGKLDEAIAAFRHGLDLVPDSAVVHSKLSYTLYFHPDYDTRAIYQEARRFNEVHCEPLKNTIRPHTNNRDPNRRIKIGYVSPDFWAHVQSYFMVPLLKAHDHRDFEIHCYASVPSPDAVTATERQSVDVWHDVLGLTDAELAEQIRRDEIDILVDLTMHMAGNRMLVFARKPAPIQVTWLAYPGTTGLSAIDYRFTDPYLDPVVSGQTSVAREEATGSDHWPLTTDHCYSEQSIRLPHTFWCYDPLTTEPTPNPLPALSAGHITFGCLNNFCKINDAVLALWSRIMHALPTSRLVLLAPEGDPRQRIIEKLAIDPGRIDFVSMQPHEKYLETFHRIDLALDTFPYNGHTTSLDSLWMGVPILTLVGPTIVGRAGLCQLSNLNGGGLPDLIAHNESEYLHIALNLANNLPHLATLRTTLRTRMEKSPLMDNHLFARNLESAYRTMWKKYCKSSKTEPVA